MEFILTQAANGDLSFNARREGETSPVIPMAGSATRGENDKSFSPMEMLLMSVGGCMSIDIVSILKKQKQTITSYDLKVAGNRADAVPAVFTNFTFHLDIKGDIKPNKLEQAISLSKEKYCSVYHSLDDKITLDVTYTINDEISSDEPI